MKVAILCGGLGTRLAEETTLRPKPMVEVGGWPILWHIMRIYGRHGFREFVLALGYKGDVVKSFFLNSRALNSDVTVDLRSGQVAVDGPAVSDFLVQMRDTGQGTMTGGRLRRLAPVLSQGGTFLLTYGDAVSDVDVRAVVEFHRSHGKLATVTAVHPPARFGEIEFDGDRVASFKEKPQTGSSWINGGFFVLEPKVFDYIDGDDTVLEGAPLERLAAEGELMAYRHSGFWQCMDTVRDRQLLEQIWATGDAPWGKAG